MAEKLPAEKPESTWLTVLKNPLSWLGVAVGLLISAIAGIAMAGGFKGEPERKNNSEKQSKSENSSNKSTPKKDGEQLTLFYNFQPDANTKSAPRPAGQKYQVITVEDDSAETPVNPKKTLSQENRVSKPEEATVALKGSYQTDKAGARFFFIEGIAFAGLRGSFSKKENGEIIYTDLRPEDGNIVLDLSRNGYSVPLMVNPESMHIPLNKDGSPDFSKKLDPTTLWMLRPAYPPPADNKGASLDKPTSNIAFAAAQFDATKNQSFDRNNNSGLPYGIPQNERSPS